MLPHWPLRLYYDGDCPLCAREVALLRRRNGAERLVLIDISQPDFDPASTPFSLIQLQTVLHAQDANGHWLKGLDATYASWLAADLWQLSWLLAWRPLRRLLHPLYRLFCWLRPGLTWLPHPDGASRCTKDRCAPGKRRN